jgi:hypothetical protein
MAWLGGLKRIAVLSLLAAGLAGCGGVTYVGSSNPFSTPVPARELASPIPAGTDSMTALSTRPMRPPVLAPNASCALTAADLGAAAPNYTFGAGPVEMSGQSGWYSRGQVAMLTVDATYSGPLLMRGFQLNRAGTVTLAELALPASAADKEKQHGVDLVPAVHTAGGGLYLQAVVPSSFSRGWLGWLTTAGPGCFGLQVDGDVFTEFIVFSVKAGTPPPG